MITNKARNMMRELQIAFITSPMIRRWMRILTIIEQEETFTTITLADKLAISQRTLVKDIHLIKEHFGDSVAIYSNNTGFRFAEIDRLMYQEKKEELLDQDALYEILERIFYGDFADLDELAHQYNYAETTLRRFLKKTQPTLEEYDLSLSFKPVKFIGEESNIRKFFFDFYYGGEKTPQTVRPPDDLHAIIRKELSVELKTYKIGTGISIAAFYSLLYLTMVRVKQEQLIKVPEWTKRLVYQDEDYQLFESLIPIIDREYGILLPKDELVWLYLMIVSKRTTSCLEYEQCFLLRFDQWPQTTAIVTDYFSNELFSQWDRPLLITFTRSYFIAWQLSNALWPIWNKQQIEVRHIAMQQSSYEKNVAFLKKHQEELRLSATALEELAVGFTLFIELLIHSHQPRQNILFLLEGDSMVVQSIRLQAQRLLGESYQLNFLSLPELTEERLKSNKTDLIVTNYRPYIFDYELEKDYLLINTIPNQKDWDQLMQRLNTLVTS
ncbi:HTH domain-containing protein [Enterococcus casseliflavus]|nr:HTH domain-containing protein [Enterococcus casseliflavus]